MTSSDLKNTEEQVPSTGGARQLGWGRFTLQFFTVVVVYLMSGIPAIVIWGETSTGAAVSVATSMAGALFVSWLWLRADGALGEAWNLRTPDSLPKTLLWAVIATVAIVIWFTVGAMLVEAAGFGLPDVKQVIGWATESHFAFLLWIVLVALFAAGLGEELLWRGFLMDRLVRLPGLAEKVWPVILIQGALFGLPHFYQGLGGVIITGVVGIGFGWLRMRFGGNLWACVLAHMAVDVLMLSLAYSEKLGLIAA
ncbi:MAG: CPBP family intramembrane metalloprotease [Erythrobacter sp.]|nr:CPBP family intramembrane metalloprotease [Erythrobacter sp.]